MKHRKTGANVIVGLVGKGYQCTHIGPEFLLASDFQQTLRQPAHQASTLKCIHIHK
jgi:hypothetical protein